MLLFLLSSSHVPPTLPPVPPTLPLFLLSLPLILLSLPLFLLPCPCSSYPAPVPPTLPLFLLSLHLFHLFLLSSSHVPLIPASVHLPPLAYFSSILHY
ncbi:hypothetical protein Pmani_031098 [Petrolisthes manimaculis]|uniref:Uncharacterized protein n=1 Tax=Petrolisthes manimaculis TaxID=1843537 RepID=A0AAE1TSU7_9EUCA|nr:hypothetical protein Pmani_031098 [Petrolisthes manimaculis]